MTVVISSELPPRTPNFLPIEFAIVGGSIAGLSAAIALSRAGHKVTVFDAFSYDEAIKGVAQDGSTRLPPNSTKVYYRWGMQQRLKECAIHSGGNEFADFDSGSIVGEEDWEEAVMEETGGDFLFLHYTDLRRVLIEFAKEYGATLRYGCKVVGVQADPARPEVKLEGGEVVTADVIIGADGCLGDGYVCRKAVMEETEQDEEYKETDMQLFKVLLPDEDVERAEDKELLAMLRKGGKGFVWLGPDCSALGYPLKSPTGESFFSLYLFTHRDPEAESKGLSDTEMLLGSIKGADMRLLDIAQHATHVKCIPMVERPSLEEWIHPDGRILCIGEAAHPIPVGSVYALGMAAGDAAVLGRVFAHLHRKEQIDSFLSAVQEIRQGRVESVIEGARGNLFGVSLPEELAEAHDMNARERVEQGKKHLGHGTSEEMMMAVMSIFEYDPEDEADDWWVEWGLMQERAAHWTISDSVAVVVEDGDENEKEEDIVQEVVVVQELESGWYEKRDWDQTEAEDDYDDDGDGYYYD